MRKNTGEQEPRGQEGQGQQVSTGESRGKGGRRPSAAERDAERFRRNRAATLRRAGVSTGR